MSSGPITLPATWLRRGQLVPNWKAMTMPLTTPMPKDTAKIFCQKKYSSRQMGFFVRSHWPSTKASQLAVPMVKAGNSTWKLMTNPNWIRDNNNASTRRLRSILWNPHQSGPISVKRACDPVTRCFTLSQQR